MLHSVNSMPTDVPIHGPSGSGRGSTLYTAASRYVTVASENAYIVQIGQYQRRNTCGSTHAAHVSFNTVCMMSGGKAKVSTKAASAGTPGEFGIAWPISRLYSSVACRTNHTVLTLQSAGSTGASTGVR